MFIKKSIPPRRCHSIRAAEMGQAEPDIVRAGRPRSRGGLTASSFTGEPFAKFRRQGFYGPGEGTGNSRGRSALCLNGHKRHKSWNRQVSNLIQESGLPERGSPSNGHKRHKNGNWARLEPYFVTFVLFVVEPFTPFARQRELSREKPGERSLVGQVRSLLSHGDARFRILQKAQGFFTWMHRMHRIFSGKGWLVIPGIRKPAPDHRPSRLLMQQPLVLLILLILCIHVHKKIDSASALPFDPCGGDGPG